MTSDVDDQLAVAELPGRGRTLRVTGDVGEYIIRRLQTTGAFYEADVLEALERLPLGPGLVVDAGANIGNHTLYFAEHLGRKVLALEPESHNFRLLAANVESNDLGGMVEVMEVALWHEPTTVSMVQRIEGNSGSFSAAEGGGSVQAVRLDDVVGDRRVALIKIDTEGAELEVLRGAELVIRRDRPFLCLEAHDATSFRSALEWLSPRGYAVVEVAGRSDNYIFGPAGEGADPQFSDTGLFSRLAVRRLEQTVNRRLDALTRKVETESRAVVDTHHALAADESARLESLMDHVTALHRAEQEARHRREEQELAHARAAAERLAQELRTAQARLAAQETTAELWRQSYAALAESRTLQTATRAARLLGRRPTTMSVTERAAWVESRASRKAGSVPSGFVEVPVTKAPVRDVVRAGIASMPSRAEGLRRVLDAIYPQVDEVYVYLNRYKEVPHFLQNDPRLHVLTGPDVGDRGKFSSIDGFSGYFLTVDDDINYPRFYVDHLIDGIERYGRRAVVGWHGSLVKQPFTDYYSSQSRRVFSFRSNRPEDTPVHLLGTGCVGFHTSTMKVQSSDFTKPNMADVFFALQGQRQQVPFVVLKHGAGWATPMPDETRSSISEASIDKAENKRLNVRRSTNALVKEHGSWKLHRTSGYRRAPLNVAIIGRTDTERWKKGGIIKSTHLTADMLRLFGSDVHLADIETGDTRTLDGFLPDVVIVYPGDPERPDFADCLETVEHHLAQRRKVVLNLSLDGRPERTEEIISTVRRLRADFGPYLHLLTFGDEVSHSASLEPIKGAVVALPKSIGIPGEHRASHARTDGVFLGDIGKLLDPRIIGQPDVDVWLRAIREALPEAPLLAVAQYQPKVPRDLGVEVLPFLKGPKLSQRLSRMRVMVNLTHAVTFDMLPVEAAGLGVPVLYRRVPQSLSEYLGMAGMQVETPQELAAVLPDVYRDPAVWRSLSRAGVARATSVDHRSLAGQLYMRLRALATTAREDAPSEADG